MTDLLQKCMRTIALALLVAGLILPSAPSHAHAAATGMSAPCHDHGNGTKPAKPMQQADCCIAGTCAFNLALPAVMLPTPQPAVRAVAYASRFAFPRWGVDALPATHPPKAT